MKEYVKPELYYESFELSQHIAACALQLGLSGVEECKVINDRLNGTATGGFISAPTCEFPLEDYCYSNGTGSMGTTFTS